MEILWFSVCLTILDQRPRGSTWFKSTAIGRVSFALKSHHGLNSNSSAGVIHAHLLHRSCPLTQNCLTLRMYIIFVPSVAWPKQQITNHCKRAHRLVDGSWSIKHATTVTVTVTFCSAGQTGSWWVVFVDEFSTYVSADADHMLRNVYGMTWFYSYWNIRRLNKNVGGGRGFGVRESN